MNELATTLALSERTRFRLRAKAFWLLAEHGAFDEHGKTELIDGEIYQMSPQHTRHARTKTRLLVALAERLRMMGGEFEAIAEVSVNISDTSVPEPDIVVARPIYERVMRADSVAIAIEVSDTTLRFDSGRKAELYAAAGIGEYWIVDVNDNRIIMHDRPEQGIYARRRVVPFGKSIVAATIAGLEIDTEPLIL